MNGKDNTMAATASGINILAGIWLIIAPFILRYSGTSYSRNDITIGIIVGIIALIRFFSPNTTNWLSWVNVILGLWLIIAPLFFGAGITASIWNDVIVGIIIVAMSIWSTSSASQSHRPHVGHGTHGTRA